MKWLRLIVVSLTAPAWFACVVNYTETDEAGTGSENVMAYCDEGGCDEDSGQPQDVQGTQDFHGALQPYGAWVVVQPYGTVWVPHGHLVGSSWTPYTRGRWAYTEYGWTWVSDYEWGWAPFHYGNWAFVAGHGWVWVPGTVWAPSYVVWRHGGGYVGWAPLPPAGVVVVRSQPTYWVFVHERYVVAPRMQLYYVPAVGVFHHTVIISTTYRVRHVYVYHGPRYRHVRVVRYGSVFRPYRYGGYRVYRPWGVRSRSSVYRPYRRTSRRAVHQRNRAVRARGHHYRPGDRSGRQPTAHHRAPTRKVPMRPPAKVKAGHRFKPQPLQPVRPSGPAARPLRTVKPLPSGAAKPPIKPVRPGAVKQPRPVRPGAVRPEAVKPSAGGVRPGVKRSVPVKKYSPKTGPTDRRVRPKPARTTPPGRKDKAKSTQYQYEPPKSKDKRRKPAARKRPSRSKSKRPRR